MKRRIILILFSILLLCCYSQVLAENIDLSAMSLDELAELGNDIRLEIEKRIGSIYNSIIYPGVYIVGKDIKAGEYTFTVTKEKEKASDGMIIFIFDDIQKYEEHKNDGIYSGLRSNAKTFFGVELDETIVISLEDGEILIISWGEASVAPFVKPIWAP